MGVRETLHSVYTFVRSTDMSQHLGSLTLEGAIEQQIQALKAGNRRPVRDATGRLVTERPSRYDRLNALEAAMDQLVQSARKGEGLKNP